MQKILILLMIFSFLIFAGCPSEPTSPEPIVENNKPKFTLSILDTLLSCEGISFIDFKIQDSSSAYERRVDAFYQGEQVGFAFADEYYLDGSARGTIHLNTFSLPSNVRLTVTAKNDLKYADTVFINLSIIKRTGVEYFSSTHGGQLVNQFNSVKEGVKVTDGSVWIVTGGGLLIIHPDFSISTHTYNGINGQGGNLREIVSDSQGEARLIDNEGRILNWNGTTFESLGQISIPYGQNLNNVIFVDGEYYGIVNYSTGTILRYNPETDSTIVYNLINHICSAEALSKGPGNQVLAAFGVSAENQTKLFRLQNEEWNEITMPVNESSPGTIVMYCDNQDRLWFGYDSKLYEVTGSNFRLIQIPESLNAPGVNSYCYNNDRIKSLIEDGDGSIWIAKGSGGLIRYYNNEIYVYPGVLLSERFHSCSSLEPDIKQVFQGINGGTFVLGYGSPVGNVLKNLVKE